jgi:hypothetical protein
VQLTVPDGDVVQTVVVVTGTVVGGATTVVVGGAAGVVVVVTGTVVVVVVADEVPEGGDVLGAPFLEPEPDTDVVVVVDAPDRVASVVVVVPCEDETDDAPGELGLVDVVVAVGVRDDPEVIVGAVVTLDAAELAVWATNNAVVTPEPTKIACVRRRMFDSRRRRW